MEKDRTEGTAKEVGGGAKETVGKATGNRKTEAEGSAQKNEGKLQQTVGKIKDALFPR